MQQSIKELDEILISFLFSRRSRGTKVRQKLNVGGHDHAG
jgi:hypothetical protein